MSFGWSAGDVFEAINLVVRVINSFRAVDGARGNFQELEEELNGLRKSLENINSLSLAYPQEPEIKALESVSCSCVETLNRFAKRIEPFQASLGEGSKRTKLRAAPRMVRWELLVKKDIPELRTYIVAHVGNLNLQLNTASLYDPIPLDIFSQCIHAN